METIFQLSNLLVMPFWFLMILLPHWRWTKRIMASLWTVVPAALLYAILVLPNFLALLGELANPELGINRRLAWHTRRGNDWLDTLPGL